MPWMMATSDLPLYLAVHGTSTPRYHQMPQLGQTVDQGAIELALDTDFTAFVPPLPPPPPPPPSINYHLQNDYPLMQDRMKKPVLGVKPHFPQF